MTDHVDVWDLENDKKIFSIPAMIDGMAITRDGNSILINTPSARMTAGGGFVMPGKSGSSLWNARTGEKERDGIILGGVMAFSPDNLQALAFKTMIGGSPQLALYDVKNDQVIREFDLPTEKNPVPERPKQPERNPVPERPKQPEKSRISARPKQRAKAARPPRQQATAPQVEAKGPANMHVLSISFSPAGDRALAGTVDHGMFLWDVKTGQMVRAFTKHDGRVFGVAFSPDGRRALSCGAGKVEGGIGNLRIVPTDCTVRLWDLESGDELACFKGDHPQAVSAVAFSPGGRRALSGDVSGLIRLWALPE
jgi:WD40 repeat protein